MRIGRIILGVALSVALVVSLAPGNPSERPNPSQKSHGCCQRDEAPGPTPRNCDGGPCTMQCCRMVPMQADEVPALVGYTSVVQIVVLPPHSLYSLTDPDAIFHPPRA